jgi:hypothetical protein
MAIAYSYPKGTPALNDTIIGIQYEENKEPAVKQFSIDEVLDLVPVVNTELPYKVYTALLTQIGESSQQILTSGNSLTIGVTYVITDDGPGYVLGDFTNVGAPNNELGTSFVATGTTPNDWGTDIILLYDTGVPVVTVLENTIGNIWFTYISAGEYSINSNELFTTDKTFVIIVAGSVGRPDILATYTDITDSNISLLSYRIAEDDLQDDLLLNASIEIRVYK